MNATRKAFMELGISDFDTLYSQARQSGIFDDLDKGKISAGTFRDAMRRHIPHTVSDEQIDAAWDAMLLDVPKDRLVLLEQLKQHYRTFLLSNTNVIHVKNFSAALLRNYGSPDFSPYFEKCYYSCDIGLRKPDAEIFLHVLNENGLQANETVFIDDSVQHVEGAKRVGISAYLLKDISVDELLKQIGIRVN